MFKKFMSKKRNKKRGFTLIELIIVIAIIAILAAIAVPAFGKIREKSNVSADVANARTIYSLVATELASDNLDSTKDVTPLSTEQVVSSQIEPEPKVKTYQDYEFAYQITDGQIQIWVVPEVSTLTAGNPFDTSKSFKVYPNATGKYSTAITTDTDTDTDAVE